MATYQEQLAKLQAQREQRDRAESSFQVWAEALADSLMPLLRDGTLTQDQAAKVMVAVTKGITGLAERLHSTDRGVKTYGS
jgi:acyl-CoA hydrolase